MADNLLQAAMSAAWKTDPVFVVLAKSLYGKDADYQDIAQEVFKADPDPSAVHIPGGSKKKKIMDNRALIDDKEELGKVLAESIAKGLITNQVAMEVAKDWAEYDRLRTAAKKDPTWRKEHKAANRNLVGALGAGYGASGAVVLGVHHDMKAKVAAHDQQKAWNAARAKGKEAVHLKDFGRSAEEIKHAHATMDEAMKMGEEAKKLGSTARTSARIAHGSKYAAMAGAAGYVGLLGNTFRHAAKQGKRETQIRRELASKRMTTGQAAALGGVTGAGVGLTIAGPKAGAVTGGVAAGAVAASTHYHRKYLKEHIKNRHPGHYDKCGMCSQRRASSVIKILRSPVIKEWAEFDAKRAGQAGLVAGVGTGAVLQYQSNKVKTNVLADVVEGKTNTAKGSARGLEDLAHAASLSRRGGKAALLGVTAAVAGEAVAHHKKAEKAEVSKLSGYDYEDKHLGYTWTDRVGYHPERGAIWQHNPTNGKPFYTAEKDGQETPFDGEYKKFAPDRRPNVNRNIHDPSPTVRAFAPKRDQDGKFAKSDVTWEGEFSKIDEDKRQVFGWASVTEIDGKPVVDLQGDYIHPIEMERAAYDYVLKSRKGGDMHRRVDENGHLIEKADAPLHVSDMIESMVFTPEKVAKLGLPEGSLPTGWWVGFKVNDENTWNLVKNDQRKGFSIHGMGSRMEKRLEEIDPQSALVGKAFEESDSYEEFQANLETLSEVTGDEVYKHLAHGINNPEGHNQYTPGVNMQPDGTTTRNEIVGAGLGIGVGSHLGALAGMATGKHEGRNVGMAVGALTGAAAGAYLGHRTGSTPQRPPIVEAALGPKLEKTSKAVSTSNRTGSMGHLQNYYQQQALQEATAALAPQVAQHIQMMQQQKWQQAQIEQQQLQQQAGGQKPQDWRTQGQQQGQQGQQPQMAMPMGPYDQGQQDYSNGGVTPGQGGAVSSI